MSARKHSSSSSRRRGSSRGRAKRRRTTNAPPLEPGKRTNTPGFTLRSYEVGALPLINHLLGRMRLEELLRQYLPPDDPRAPRSLAVLGSKMAQQLFGHANAL